MREEGVVPGLVRQLDDRRRSQSAVQVVVQEDLRDATDLLERGGHRSMIRAVGDGIAATTRRGGCT